MNRLPWTVLVQTYVCVFKLMETKDYQGSSYVWVTSLHWASFLTKCNKRWKPQTLNYKYYELLLYCCLLFHVICVFCALRLRLLRELLAAYASAAVKVIFTKYSKRWTLYYGTNYSGWLCVQKMLYHGLNHGFFLLLFKLISCPIHWIVCVLAYLNFIFEILEQF